MANQPSKYSKFLVGAASAALVASAVAPVASAADFKDTKGNTHEEAINALSDAGVIKGYSDGTFLPNKTLTRSDVVKMMGKWLVTQGHDIPTDARTNPRFTDLTTKTNVELLDYAAVVKDSGVFIGNNGKLLAVENITRENMALVLVRAFDKVNDIDLVAYVNAQEFTKDVKDLSTAKKEAQAAINVLDFFNITNPEVSSFNPKGNTTRGHFATFLNKSINTDFSVVTVGTGVVKAINTTTVEVTFKEAVSDINSLKFTIEGLEVKNAAVKQTDAKTVVLTTATQEGGKKYTVKSNTDEIGHFIGISAVIPEKVTMVTTSLQGVVGKEITVKADINVKSAGVPVTFNVVSTNRTINKDHVVEVYTNAEGIAEYSYTQYSTGEDTVQAYATGKANARANGKVYWANAIQLAVSEITTGNDLTNEAKKSYKVAGKANSTYYIAIKENLGVTPDKITDVKVQNHTNVAAQNFVTPYELTTGAKTFAAVTTNANGEGSFTVYGTNLSATPIVYLPSSVNTSATDYSYSATALQAQAPTVKFSQVDRLTIAAVGEGTADSAEYYNIPTKASTNSAGGRTYTVTVSDKDGKIAPAGTVAHVKFADMAGDVYFSTGGSNFVKLAKDDIKPLTVGKDGKVQFRVAGKGATSYVKPTVFLNTAGTVSPVVLDTTDVQAVADVTYFKTPVVTNAVLTVEDAQGRVIKSLLANQDAYFTYQSVDQNGFAYRPGAYTTTPGSTTTIYVQHTDPVTGVVTFVPQVVTNAPITSTSYVLAFDVTSTFGNAIVKDANGITLPSVQNIGSTKTYNVTSNAEGVAVVRVTSQSVDTVSVNVTGASNILPTATASVSFTSSSELPAIHTGFVTNLNEVAETIKIDAYNAVSYNGGSYTNTVNQPISKAQFVAALKSVAAGQKAQVTATKQANGTYSFNINSLTVTKTPEELLAEAQANLITKEAEVAAKVQADYTVASWASFTTAKGAADALPVATTANINAKILAYNNALGLLVSSASDEAARQAALNSLATAKKTAEGKKAADYTTASWATFNTAITTTIPAMQQDTVNQINAKAKAYTDAVSALDTKAVIGNISATVNVADANTGKLVFTFTEANSLAGFDIDLYSDVTGAVDGTSATVADTGSAAGTLTVTVDPSGVYDLSVEANRGATYTFTATAVGTDAVAKDIKVTVKFDGGAWKATVSNK